MKKYDVIRKIRVIGDDFSIKNDLIKAYKYKYKDIEFAIYKTDDYDSICKGYISIIISNNENINGLGLCVYGYKTIKECYYETLNLIDKEHDKIINIIMEVK